MKIFSFFYFTGFEIMVKDFPQEDPHHLTLKDISMPISLFFTLLLMLVFIKTEIWFYVIAIWDPNYVRGGKFNPFSPSSILFLICWFVTAKVLKLYFQQKNVQKEILAYYRINNNPTNKYDTHGRLLLLFLFLSPFLTGALGWFYGWYGALPLVLAIILIEAWIRREFEGKRGCDT